MVLTPEPPRRSKSKPACAPEPPFSAAMKDDEEEGAGVDADDLDGDDCVPGAVSNRGELSFLAISKSGGSNGSMPLLKDTDVRCSRICKEKHENWENWN